MHLPYIAATSPASEGRVPARELAGPSGRNGFQSVFSGRDVPDAGKGADPAGAAASETFGATGDSGAAAPGPPGPAANATGVMSHPLRRDGAKGPPEAAPGVEAAGDAPGASLTVPDPELRLAGEDGATDGATDGAAPAPTSAQDPSTASEGDEDEAARAFGLSSASPTGPAAEAAGRAAPDDAGPGANRPNAPAATGSVAPVAGAVQALPATTVAAAPADAVETPDGSNAPILASKLEARATVDVNFPGSAREKPAPVTSPATPVAAPPAGRPGDAGEPAIWPTTAAGVAAAEVAANAENRTPVGPGDPLPDGDAPGTSARPVATADPPPGRTRAQLAARTDPPSPQAASPGPRAAETDRQAPTDPTAPTGINTPQPMQTAHRPAAEPRAPAAADAPAQVPTAATAPTAVTTQRAATPTLAATDPNVAGHAVFDPRAGDPGAADPGATQPALSDARSDLHAPARASAPGPVTFHAPETARNAAVQVAEVVRAGGERAVELRLHPEELGRVQLTMSQDASGTLTVALNVERSDTLELLRRNIDQLAAELRAMGYGSVDFSFQGEGGHAGAWSDGSDRPGSALVAAAETSPNDRAAPQARAPETPSRLASGAGIDMRL